MTDSLREFGYKAKARRTKSGRGIIDSGAGGVNFTIILYDCEGATCEDLQFRASTMGR